MTKESSRNKKIGYTVLLVTLGIVLMALFAGGLEFGSFKLPSISTKIKADVDVERSLLDVKIVKTSIRISQGSFSVGKPFGILDSIVLGEKKLFLKMYVDGSFCDSAEFSIEGRGVQSKKLSCDAKKGNHEIRIDLYDTSGLEDSYKTTFEVA